MSEVVVRTSLGAELGRCSPARGDTTDAPATDLDAVAFAADISEMSGISVAGQTWAEVLPFLSAQPFIEGTGGNFCGVLFTMESGEFERQRPLDEYRDLTLVFAPTRAAVHTAFQESSRRSF